MDGTRPPECIGDALGTYFIDNKHYRSALDSNNNDKSAFSRIWPNAAEHPIHGQPVDADAGRERGGWGRWNVARARYKRGKLLVSTDPQILIFKTPPKRTISAPMCS